MDISENRRQYRLSESIYSRWTGPNTPTLRKSCESCVAEYLLARCLAICSSSFNEEPACCGGRETSSCSAHGPGDISAGECENRTSLVSLQNDQASSVPAQTCRKL